MVQRLSADSSEGPPALWAVDELAVPIAERLRLHFTTGQPTDRADKPEWLFSTAVRVTRQLAPEVAPLQAAIEAHSLQGAIHLPFEFAAAVRSAVQVGGPARLLLRVCVTGIGILLGVLCWYGLIDPFWCQTS